MPHIAACLQGPTAAERLLGAYTVTFWAQELQEQQQQDGGGDAQPAPAAGAGAAAGAAQLPADLQQLVPLLLELLAAPTASQQPFAELAPLYTQLRSQASAVVARAVAAGVPLALPAPLEALGAEGALALATQVPPGAGGELALGRQALASTAGLLQSSEAFLATGASAGLAVAVVTLGALPPKLNAVIQPLVGAGPAGAGAGWVVGGW